MKRLHISRHTRRYFAKLRFDYDARLKDAIKLFPGVGWKKPHWIVAAELVPMIEAVAKELGYKVANNLPPVAGMSQIGVINENLRAYQRTAVARAVGSRHFVFGEEQGLGKTPEAIESARLLGARRVVVVCPAIARRTWEDELQMWWPEHPPVHRISTEKEAKNVESILDGDGVGFVVVVSYSLANHLPETLRPEVTILDEVHILQGETAKRTAVCGGLASRSTAGVFGLSGTNFTNKIASGYRPSTIVFPGIVDGKYVINRLGTFHQYKARYMEGEQISIGRGRHVWKHFGCRQDTADELSMRLGAFTSYADRDTVSRLLPPFITSNLWYSGDVGPAVKEWLDNGRVGGDKFFCILTHFRETARTVAKQLEGVCITGETPADGRHTKLEKLREKGGGIVVATMHSLLTSIDLTFMDKAAIIELPNRVADLGQILGRFSRVIPGGGVRSSVVNIFANEGGDPRADAMAMSIRALNHVQGGGRFNDAMATAAEDMRNLGRSEEEIKNALSLAAESYSEGLL